MAASMIIISWLIAVLMIITISAGALTIAVKLIVWWWRVIGALWAPLLRRQRR